MSGQSVIKRGSQNNNKPTVSVDVFVSEAAVQRGREEQGNHTGSVLHGILLSFPEPDEKTIVFFLMIISEREQHVTS